MSLFCSVSGFCQKQDTLMYNTDFLVDGEYVASPIKERDDRFILPKINIAQLAVGVVNIGVELNVNDKYSIDIPYTYSPYTLSQKWKLKILSLQPEVRYWLNKQFSGHFVGLHTHVGYFNLAFNENSRYQNQSSQPLWGAGVGYGYVMQLYKALNIEFNIGIGYSNIKYSSYYNVDNGAKYDFSEKNYWGVTRVGISLTYLFKY